MPQYALLHVPGPQAFGTHGNAHYATVDPGAIGMANRTLTQPHLQRRQRAAPAALAQRRLVMVDPLGGPRALRSPRPCRPTWNGQHGSGSRNAPTALHRRDNRAHLFRTQRRLIQSCPGLRRPVHCDPALGTSKFGRPVATSGVQAWPRHPPWAQGAHAALWGARTIFGPRRRIVD